MSEYPNDYEYDYDYDNDGTPDHLESSFDSENFMDSYLRFSEELEARKEEKAAKEEAESEALNEKNTKNAEMMTDINKDGNEQKIDGKPIDADDMLNETIGSVKGMWANAQKIAKETNVFKAVGFMVLTTGAFLVGMAMKFAFTVFRVKQNEPVNKPLGTVVEKEIEKGKEEKANDKNEQKNQDKNLNKEKTKEELEKEKQLEKAVKEKCEKINKNADISVAHDGNILKINMKIDGKEEEMKINKENQSIIMDKNAKLSPEMFNMYHAYVASIKNEDKMIQQSLEKNFEKAFVRLKNSNKENETMYFFAMNSRFKMHKLEDGKIGIDSSSIGPRGERLNGIKMVFENDENQKAKILESVEREVARLKEVNLDNFEKFVSKNEEINKEEENKEEVNKEASEEINKENIEDQKEENFENADKEEILEDKENPQKEEQSEIIEEMTIKEDEIVLEMTGEKIEEMTVGTNLLENEELFKTEEMPGDVEEINIEVSEDPEK